MVHLATMSSGFEAQLLVARLGAEGVVWQLQGPVGGPLPLSDVSVLVGEDDLVLAREILHLGDQAEDLVGPDRIGYPVERSGRSRGVSVALVVGVVILTVSRTIGMHLI